MPWNAYYAGQEIASGISLEVVDNLTSLYLRAADQPEPWLDIQGLDTDDNVAITRVLASRHIPLSFLPS
ncbi:hypothetical protein DEU34_2293 [Microbacterium sp. AG1240]|uniref:hypothetical protein n=1 Tax=Microbacterium sp. AG1240 TaxID=2183992 RepID=UPI000EADC5F2|nr:hypothetical protein [Microbacterium sp. AG1240]RKT33689.1 hypothetical protein DEU34_2293 [Microbacterium sp. AG1240]